MWLLFLLLSFFSGEMQIVLTNGKIMNCESFEVKGRMVYVKRSGQTFMLPLSTVDINRSGPVPELEEKVEKKEVKTADRNQLRKRSPVSLTTKDLRSISPTSTKGVIHFRKIDNSVIVEVTINGTGPFSILLDTGASTTVINPTLMRELKALKNSRPVPMVGLSGQAVSGLECKLDSISLAGQELRSFTVVSFSIPHLTELGVVGLLGQDFLNHFIMNMDSSINQITLTPHGQSVGPSTRETAQDLREKFESWDQSITRLNSITRSTGNYLRQAANSDVISRPLARKASRDLTQYLQEMNGIRSDASSLYAGVSQLKLEELNSSDSNQVRGFLNCYSAISLFLAELQSFCGRLKNYYNNPNNSGIIGNLDELLEKQEAVINCR